jgi:hypothetical protein
MLLMLPHMPLPMIFFFSNTDAETQNVARHLAGAYDVLLMPPLLPMLKLPRHLI